MFTSKLFTYLTRLHISKSKTCFNVKFPTYYFHMKTKILADFQICINVPLRLIDFYCLTKPQYTTIVPIVKFLDCVKSVQIRSYFWSVFSCIRTRNNSIFGQFSRIVLIKDYQFPSIKTSQ